MLRLKWGSSKSIFPILLILLLLIAGCGNNSSKPDNSSEKAKTDNTVVTKAGVVTYENYQKINFDSTYDDVKSILGAGTKKELNSDVDSYKWDDQGKTITIQTTNGKVSFKSQTNIGKTTANLTEDQFNKITKDMTFDQVVAILGPDYQEQNSKKSGKVITRFVAWVMPDSKSIKVKFQDDKVVNTNNYLK